MSFVETLLSESLKSRNPLLDLRGTDSKVLHTAYQDFINYLKVHWNLVGEKGAKYKLVDRLNDYFHEKPDELEEFIDVWTGLWMKKWNERVKLLIGENSSKRWSRTSRLLAKAEPLWIKLKNREEAKEIVIETLIKNGEICGTSILAENLLKMELGLSANKKSFSNERERLLNIVNNALRRAREISKSKGPLIFVKLNKKFFQQLGQT